MANPNESFPTVDDVQIIESRGPWASKSGGELNVQFALPLDVVQNRLLNYDQAELDQIPEDIRGLRSYTVRGIPEGSIGANKWHRVRRELIVSLEGAVQWTVEDVYGGKKEVELNGDRCVLMPPYILHTYRALSENCGLLVLANTLFNPEDKRTHDTYPAESFRELQAQHAGNRGGAR